VNVQYPSEVYKGENLSIIINLSNIGNAGKDVQIEISSTYYPTVIGQTRLNDLGAITNITLLLPVGEIGQQAFTVRVYWIGPAPFVT
jgi:hypothetical protein